MTSLKPYARQCLTQCPHVKPIDVEDIMATGERFCHLNLLTISQDDLKHVKVRAIENSYKAFMYYLSIKPHCTAKT